MADENDYDEGEQVDGTDDDVDDDDEKKEEPEAPADPNAKTFANLQPKLSDQTLSVVSSLGFKTPTPVQAAAIPLFLTHKDVAAEAVTGSGKTLAFVIPIVEILKRPAVKLGSMEIGAIILSPTRELASQLYHVVSLFGLPSVLLVGGTEVSKDLELCRTGCDIVVATPGRLLDILARPDGPSVSSLEVLVMDEADTLLDMGFETAVNDILARLPKQRRTGLFSATMTREVQKLARAGLRNPAFVSVKVHGAATQKQQKTPVTLTNHYMMCDIDQRLGQLIAFLKQHAGSKLIVFFLTCASVDYFAKVVPVLLNSPDFPIWSLHGKMVQKRRAGTYDKFVKSDHGALLCTDVVARGIDVPDVDWIVQYDPPSNPSFYVHRVGRTARAGRAGKSLIFLTPTEDTYIHFLGVYKIPITPIDPLPVHGDELDKAKQLARTDRDILEKGTAAFVAFVRGYREHQCPYIFQFSKLDLAAVARSFALLRLPHVSELRNVTVDFVDDPVDTFKIPYLDKEREKQRLVRAQAVEAERKAEEEAEAIEAAKHRADKPDKPEKPVKRKRTHKSFTKRFMEDWDELAVEERLAKRLRQGKISQEEYDEAVSGFGNRPDSDEDLSGDDDEPAPSKTAQKKARAGAKAKGRGGAAGRGRGGGRGGFSKKPGFPANKPFKPRA